MNRPKTWDYIEDVVVVTDASPMGVKHSSIRKLNEVKYTKALEDYIDYLEDVAIEIDKSIEKLETLTRR